MSVIWKGTLNSDWLSMAQMVQCLEKWKTGYLRKWGDSSGFSMGIAGSKGDKPSWQDNIDFVLRNLTLKELRIKEKNLRRADPHVMLQPERPSADPWTNPDILYIDLRSMSKHIM